MTDSFVTVKRWDLQWEEDTDLLTLGSGVLVKVYRQDAAKGRLDLLVKSRLGMSSRRTPMTASIRSWSARECR